MVGYNIQMKMYAVPQVVELVEELVVLIEMEKTVVLEIYPYNKFVDLGKMHLVTTEVNEYY